MFAQLEVPVSPKDDHVAVTFDVYFRGNYVFEICFGISLNDTRRLKTDNTIFWLPKVPCI